MSREFLGCLLDDLSLAVLILPDGVPDEDPQMLVLDIRHRMTADTDVAGRDHKNEPAEYARRLVAPTADPPATLEHFLNANTRTVGAVALTRHSAARRPESQAEDMTREMSTVVFVVIMKAASANP